MPLLPPDSDDDEAPPQPVVVPSARVVEILFPKEEEKRKARALYMKFLNDGYTTGKVVGTGEVRSISDDYREAPATAPVDSPRAMAAPRNGGSRAPNHHGPRRPRRKSKNSLLDSSDDDDDDDEEEEEGAAAAEARLLRAFADGRRQEKKARAREEEAARLSEAGLSEAEFVERRPPKAKKKKKTRREDISPPATPPATAPATAPRLESVVAQPVAAMDDRAPTPEERPPPTPKVTEEDDDWLMADEPAPAPKKAPKKDKGEGAAKRKRAAPPSSSSSGGARRKTVDGGEDAPPREPKAATRRSRVDDPVADCSSSSGDEEDEAFPHLDGPQFFDAELTQRFILDGTTSEETRSLPASIARYLPEYQRDGVTWLNAQYDKKQGGVLADDMGLGKTPQSVAFLAALLGVTGNRRLDARRAKAARRRAKSRLREDPVLKASSWDTDCALVVVPTTLVANWQKELAKWIICNVGVLQGGQTGEVRENVLKLAAVGGLDVIVATHTTLRDAVIPEDGPRSWRLMIIDEVHGFKNPNSDGFKQMYEFKRRTRHGGVLGLTGTPLQNNFVELHTLLKLCTTLHLDDLADFKSHFKAIEQGLSTNASRQVRALGDVRQKELLAITQTYVLRRTKAEVLSDTLTEGKDDIIVTCELTPLQKALYRKVLDTPDVVALRKAGDPCECGRVDGEGVRIKRYKCCHRAAIELANVLDRCYFAQRAHDKEGPCERKCPYCYSFPVLNKLSKIANHPALLQLDRTKGSKNEEKQLDTEAFLRLAYGDAEFAQRTVWRSQRFDEMRRVDECGKLATLATLLESFREEDNSKCLIFSQSKQMLDLLEKFVISQQDLYLRLDGTTSQVRRQEIVDEFNDPRGAVFLMLISTRAGGMGLNLQAANRVVVFDVNWNPTHDLQAQDRAYRIGQQRKVTVFRLVAQGTFEELTYARQLYKQQLTRVAMTDQSKKKTKRLFEAIQGEVNGELFGLGNLLFFSEESIFSQIALGGVGSKKEKKKKTTTGMRQAEITDCLGQLGDDSSGEAAKLIEALGGRRNDEYMNGDYDDDDGRDAAPLVRMPPRPGLDQTTRAPAAAAAQPPNVAPSRVIPAPIASTIPAASSAPTIPSAPAARPPVAAAAPQRPPTEKNIAASGRTLPGWGQSDASFDCD